VRDTNAEFATLKAMHPAAELHSEGGKPVVLLPAFKFRAAGAGVQMNLLLYPRSHSGYVTRLFFEKKLDGAGPSKNWTEHTVLSHKWWTPSWKNVVEDQPWISMIGAHLRAVA
jgi:hypothetical protein